MRLFYFSIILVTLLHVSIEFAQAKITKTQNSHQNHLLLNNNESINRAEFPESWWAQVPKEQVKPWEIPPQNAGPNEVILSKRTELGVFSNFANKPFVYHGICYPTIEAFWQMMKYPETQDDSRWSWVPLWTWTRQEVSRMSGFQAKKAGQYANDLMSKNSANWVTFEGQSFPFSQQEKGRHFELIFEAIKEKIRQNPELIELLLKTQNLILKPDHQVSEESPQEWKFYELWMIIRSELQSQQFEKSSKEDLTLRTCQADHAY